MSRVPRKILNKLLLADRKLSLANIRAFVEYYSSEGESALATDVAEAKKMLFRTKTNDRARASIVPPAGLRARDAIPIILEYAREEFGQVVVTKEERSSLSALADALDRQFGAGYTTRVIDTLNNRPNGSSSLHYKR